MNRRQYLSAVTAGATICCSGCTGFLDKEVELLSVVLRNMQSRERMLSVRITYEGEIVEESTHELPPDDQWIFLGCTWPRESGQFAIAGRLEKDEEWVVRDLTDTESDCVAATIKATTFNHVGFTITETCDLPTETEQCGNRA